MTDCLVCVEPITGSANRLPCLTSCNHNSICSLCYLRMRSLQRNMNCPICKAPQEYLICTDTSSNPDILFQDFQIWGDSIGPEYVLDPKSSIFFPKEFHRTAVQPLWAHKCSACRQTRRDMKSLKAHMSAEHNLIVCMLCVENKQVFPAEQKHYSKTDYDKHLRHGDQDGSLGHPNCEFCRTRFYDSSALFMHLNKQHFECHICKRQGKQFKYFKDYADMETHFRRDHFLCEQPDCLLRKYTVFSNEIDLADHNLCFHPTLHSSRRAQVLPIQFKMQRSAQAEDSRSRSASSAANSSSTAAVMSRAVAAAEEVSLKVAADAVDGSGAANSGSEQRSDRYEGGLGGRAVDGEWQLEIAPFLSSVDPRASSRHVDTDNGIGSDAIDYGSGSAGFNAAAGAAVEEFPTLGPPSGSSAQGNIQLTNRWISTQQSQGKLKKNDFPALKASKKKSSAAAANKTSGGSGNNVSGTMNIITRDYAAMSAGGNNSYSNNSSNYHSGYGMSGSTAAATTGGVDGDLSPLEQAYSPPVTATSSLGDFIRIKPAGSKGAPPVKAATAATISNSNNNSNFDYDVNNNDSSSMGASEEAYPALATTATTSAELQQWVAAGTINSSAGGAATISAVKAPDLNSAQQFPTLATGTAGVKKSTVAAVKKPAAKKKPAATTAAAAGSWNDAMKSVGLKSVAASSSAPKQKLTVVKPFAATATAAAGGSSGSLDALADSSRLKAIGKNSSERDEFVYRPPLPPSSAATTATAGGKKKAPGNWAKIGGTGGEHG